MKRLFSIATLVFFFGIGNAQTIDNSNIGADSSRRHFNHPHSQRNTNGFDSKSSEQSGNSMRMDGDGRRRHDFRSFAGNRSGWAGSHLHFTSEQRAKLRTLNTQFKEKSEALYKQDDLTLRQYKSQLLALQKDRKAQMKNLLTPEQNASIEMRKKQVQEEIQIKAAANLERLKIKLNLSDDQTAKIKSQQSNFRTQIIAIRQNDDLLAYQKKDMLKALLAKRNDAIKSVLTPEQASQFEKMHKHNFGDRFERNNVN
jgi:Spy/CpxP family protein refolding chaperone